MEDEDRPREQLLYELLELRQQVADLKKSEANRKLAEDKHEKLEVRLRTIIESLPFDFFGLDTAGHYFIQNSTSREHFGDFVGKKPEDLSIDKNTLALWLDNNRRAFSGEIVKREFEVVREGEKRFYYDIVAPIYDKGTIDGILGFNIDITDRKRAEEERDRILNMSHDLICVMGIDGYFKYLNPAWEKALGYSREELLSMFVFDIISPDVRHKHREDFFAQLASGKENIGYESRTIHKDGSIRVISWTSTPLPEKGLIYCIGRDITERKRAEDEIQKRVKELEDFYDMGIGRELRMIELKDEIQELKQKLKKCEKQ